MTQKKVRCPDCGKTVAMEDDDKVYIKCSGKKEGHKCGTITEINKK